MDFHVEQASMSISPLAAIMMIMLIVSQMAPIASRDSAS